MPEKLRREKCRLGPGALATLDRTLAGAALFSTVIFGIPRPGFPEVLSS